MQNLSQNDRMKEFKIFTECYAQQRGCLIKMI